MSFLKMPIDQGVVASGAVSESSVLVTFIADDSTALDQHYRDRADAENGFYELKNQ